MPRTAALFGLALALAMAGAAQAQEVALAGILGAKALLVVGSAAPRAVGVGEEYRGITVVSVGRDSAVVQNGQRQRHELRMGAPVSVGGTGARRAVLLPDRQGHYLHQGQINGRSALLMVDTGATSVAMGEAEAGRLGIDYRKGAPVQLRTANGTAQGWRTRLDSVRVGEIELAGIEAVVTPQPMPFVLLGNSFLAQVHMTRNAQQMVLEKR